MSAMVAMGIIALKWFYSQAGAAELEWMLGPPCWLASHLANLDLVHETGAGWISHTHHMVVGAACAGVNFFIVCLAMLFFSFRARVRSERSWLATSLLLAYLVAIAVNTVRIIAAAHLYALSLAPGWLTPERLHRCAGTVLYCIGLAATYASVSACFGARRISIAPFFWYLSIALGLPLLRACWTNTAVAANFFEHAATVLAVVTVVWLALRMMHGARLRGRVGS